jgi:hypothetical protein
MPSLRSIAIMGIVAPLFAGCATPATNAATDGSREERVYRTGSNLPVRDRDQPVNTINPATIDTSMPMPPGRGG